MERRSPFEARLRPGLGVTNEDDGGQIILRIDGHLHHAAFDLVAAPQHIARHQIDALDAGLPAFFKTEQQQVGPDYRRDVRFVQPNVLATPQYLSRFAVHGVERFFSPDDQCAKFGRLVKERTAIEFRGPRR